MKQIFQIIFIYLFLFQTHLGFSQEKNQTVRGIIIDKETKQPLAEASVAVYTTNPVIGTVTDNVGKFKINNVPVGRQSIEVSFLGYESVVLQNLVVSSGKELVLTIELIEAVSDLEQIVIQSKRNKLKSLNDMATVSVQTFSVEETRRYAASLNDPARMAQVFAGVTGGGEDLGNEIIVRGNSPRGILWRLEGIDIPNPNHFANPASSGGGVSMMSANTLATSEFFSGAFPAEYGNALAGVFDINLRTGNNEKREYAFMLGALGTEISLEGPFSKNSEASYLINYRYSTLAILKPFLADFLGDFTPKYQDLTFKIKIPTEKYGTFSLFGLGGINDASNEAVKDETQWTEENDDENYFERNNLGIVGLSHLYNWENTYLKTTVAYTADLYKDQFEKLIPSENYRADFRFNNTFENKTFKAQFLANTKLNKNHTLRFGGFYSNIGFHLLSKEKNDDTNTIETYVDSEQTTNLYQAYSQWKWRFNQKFSLLTGIHTTFLALNDTYSIDPRIALQWQLSRNKILSFSVGKHSQHQHLSSYFVEKTTANAPRTFPNINLEFTKAIHYVTSYKQQFKNSWRLKTELYYQWLYDVPIEKDPSKIGSLINSDIIWDIFGVDEVSNDGTGCNYGIDLTLEKSFSNGYYGLITGSLYSSKYTPANGKTYNTRYNGNYLLNLLYGKEWKVGKNDDNLFSVNGRFSFRGGNRYSEIDIEKSQMSGQQEIFIDKAFQEQYPVYSRFDVGFKYSLNRKKLTHAFSIDIQNVLNRQNIRSIHYDIDANNLRTTYQSGLIPNFNYRITF